MYLDHYHLKEKPFNLSPGPRFLWLGEKHKEALATLNYGIIEDLGFLLLTGDVGVGKTALIHRLISKLDSSTIVAHITDPGLGTIDFFKLLAVEFNIPTEFYSKGPFLIELEKFLYAAYSDKKKVLLIVDEAQRLNNKLLDQIRVLSNIELSDRKLINIFFVGQPEFKKMLMSNSNRAIRQRIAINYHINPLTESETGQYIEHRLKVAGATRKIFKPNAMREIFRFTNGFPRAINVICDHALLTGFASGLNSIDSAVIEECEQELNIRAGFDFNRTAFQTPTGTTRPEAIAPSPRRSTSMGVPILIGLFLVMGALVSYYFLWPAPRWTMAPNTQKKLASTSNQTTDTVEKKPAQASSKIETTLAQPVKKNDIQDKIAPKEELAVTDGQPPILIAQASPAPDPLPYISEADSGVIVPDKAENESSPLPAPSDAEPGIQTEKATPDKITTSDRPAELIIATPPPPPDPLPERSKPDRDETAPGKAAAAAAAVVAALTTANPEPQADPTPRKETIAQDPPPARKGDTGAGGQGAVPAAEAAPEPDPPTDTPVVESPVTSPGKAKTDAAVVAVLAAKSAPKKAPTPRKETIAQDPPPARKGDTSADDQGAVPAAEAAPEPDPSADTTAVESDATAPGKAGANAAVVAVLAATKSSSPVNPVTPVGNASGKSATNALKPSNTQGPSATESESQATISPSKATTRETTPAKAETQLQASVEASGSTAASVEQLDVISMENRLRSFLQTYCNTYATKNLDGFTKFFAANAMENGKPFESLVPKYERNFKFIETIQYRIELQEFSVAENEQIIKIDGDFFLKWLPPDKQWRENSGKISMSLIDNGSSFLVQRLDYQGSRSKKK